MILRPKPFFSHKQDVVCAHRTGTSHLSRRLALRLCVVLGRAEPNYLTREPRGAGGCFTGGDPSVSSGWPNPVRMESESRSLLASVQSRLETWPRDH